MTTVKCFVWFVMAHGAVLERFLEILDLLTVTATSFSSFSSGVMQCHHGTVPRPQKSSVSVWWWNHWNSVADVLKKFELVSTFKSFNSSSTLPTNSIWNSNSPLKLLSALNVCKNSFNCQFFNPNEKMKPNDASANVKLIFERKRTN